jgi:hypothetical protein
MALWSFKIAVGATGEQVTVSGEFDAAPLTGSPRVVPTEAEAVAVVEGWSMGAEPGDALVYAVEWPSGSRECERFDHPHILLNSLRFRLGLAVP